MAGRVVVGARVVGGASVVVAGAIVALVGDAVGVVDAFAVTLEDVTAALMSAVLVSVVAGDLFAAHDTTSMAQPTTRARAR